MDITQQYAVALGDTVALLIITSILLAILIITRKYTTFRFLKHIYYLQVHKYLKGSEKTIRFDLALIAMFLVGNILCTAIRVNSIFDLARRSKMLSIINLILLALKAYINLIANNYGVRLGTYKRMYRQIERVAIAEGLIYTATNLSLHTINFQTLSNIEGLIVSLHFSSRSLYQLNSLLDCYYHDRHSTFFNCEYPSSFLRSFPQALSSTCYYTYSFDIYSQQI